MAVTQEAIDGALTRLSTAGHQIAILSRSGGGVIVADETKGLVACTGRIQRTSAYYYLRGIETGLALKAGKTPQKATDRGSEDTPESITREPETVTTGDGGPPE